MKRNDLVTMTSVALTTATLTVASFWAAPLEAGGEAEILTPTIAKPKLLAKGVELTLAPVSGTEKAGDEPVLELAATNTSGSSAEIQVRVAMTGMSPADALSRVVRIPTVLWECNQSLVLQPKEQKSITLATRTRLPAGNIISVALSEVVSTEESKTAAGAAQPGYRLHAAQPDIAVLSFSTPKPAPAPAIAQSNG